INKCHTVAGGVAEEARASATPPEPLPFPSTARSVVEAGLPQKDTRRSKNRNHTRPTPTSAMSASSLISSSKVGTTAKRILIPKMTT
ncbi:unnamed protein product, partial [Ectocarpus sp. 12 AP-2014]